MSTQVDTKPKALQALQWRFQPLVCNTIVHTNVGGGYDPDGLANCAFQWMVQKAELDGVGLAFDKDFVGHYAAHPESELRDSMTRFYRLFGEHLRPIGELENGRESVHPSAITRLELSPPPTPGDGGPYKPQNLLAYQQRHGDGL